MQQHATITEATFIRDASLRQIPRHRARPVHSMLASFSAAYFAGALVTDLVYWQMPDVLWERFSIWLIAAGLIMAGLGPHRRVISPARGRPKPRPAWPPARGPAHRGFLRVTHILFVCRRDYNTAVPH